MLTSMNSTDEALERLREGNRRYAEGAPLRSTVIDAGRRRELAASQAPYAVILGCSDSRVPAEIVFDCGLGELFVVRVAGNIAAPSQVASVEYAVEHLGTRLVIVLGHSGCGAVMAAVEATRSPATQGNNLSPVIDRISAVLEGLLEAGDGGGEELLARAVRANVSASAQELLSSSELLAARAQAGELVVVRAEYELESGRVEFLET
jgi:carbonic anhydrase